MARTEVRTRQIKNGTILEEDLAVDLYNELRFVKHEYDDIIVPDGYTLLADHLKVNGELRIIGDVKLC